MNPEALHRGRRSRTGRARADRRAHGRGRRALRRPVAALLVTLAAACAGSGGGAQRTAMDEAIRLFVARDYAAAQARFEALAERAGDDAERREIWYFIGRCRMETGDLDGAARAFETAVAYGDRGPSVEYLERLRGRIGNTPEAVTHRPRVDRARLAALACTMLGIETDDPMREAVRRGWMRRLPDGGLHREATVTHAALAVFLARVRVAERLGPAPAVPVDADPATGLEVVRGLRALVSTRRRRG